jgi:hypothetical protein
MAKDRAMERSDSRGIRKKSPIKLGQESLAFGSNLLANGSF